MKKVLLASTAVAAFVVFSGTAQAQDPGMADFGATEGGGGAGSAFTVKTSGAVKFYLKYATAPDTETLATKNNRITEDSRTDAGLFTLIAAELEFNGAATTDNGTDISTHIDLDFTGTAADKGVTVGGQENAINIGNTVRVQELSLKIGGDWGSVELGTNDGAEDSLKTYGGSIAAGTGGVDGDLHTVTGGVGKDAFLKLDNIRVGGTAGSGDSGDLLKATYLSPNISGFQTGISLAYNTNGPTAVGGGILGIGLGAKYAGSGGGLDYAVSVVWGDKTLLVGPGGSTKLAVEAAYDLEDDPAKKDGYGGLGIGVKLGGAGVTGVVGVTFDKLGLEAPKGTKDAPGPNIALSPGIAYAIPGGKANVSLTTALSLPYGLDPSNTKADAKPTNYFAAYLIMLSADYAVLPGVTLAVDLGYGDSDIAGKTTDEKGKVVDTKSGGFTSAFRVKAAF